MYSVEWAGFRPPFLLFFGCIPPGARLASPGLRLSRSEESQVEEPDVEPQQVHAPVPPEPPIESAELQQPQESELQVGGSRIQGLKKNKTEDARTALALSYFEILLALSSMNFVSCSFAAVPCCCQGV